MKERKPYFFLYADDFLSGVLGMSDAHVGVYMKLLCLCWSKDGVSDMEAQGVSRDDDAIQAVLTAKFYQDGDKWRNQKMEKVRRYVETQSECGKRGGAPKGNKNAAKNNRKTTEHTSEKQANIQPENNPHIHIQNHIQNHRSKDQNQENKESLSAELTGVPTVDEFFERWNRFAKKTPKITACRKLTSERKKKIAVRLKESGWFVDFCEAVASLPLGGDGWQPTLDWLIRNEHNAYRIMEGDFDWRSKDDPAATRLAAKRRQSAFEERTAREEWEKQQRKDGPKNPISSTLIPKHGSGGETTDASLLFGGEDECAVSGAELSRER